MSMLTNVDFFTTQPGQGQALDQRLLALVGPTRQEPGCLRYDIDGRAIQPTASSSTRTGVRQPTSTGTCRRPTYRPL